MLSDIGEPQEKPAGNRSLLVRAQLARVRTRYVCGEHLFFFFIFPWTELLPSLV